MQDTLTTIWMPVATEPHPLPALTPREADTVRLVALGYTNNDIAEIMTVSFRTVQTHLSNVMRKWNAVSRTQVAMLAIGRYVTLEEVQATVYGQTWGR